MAQQTRAKARTTRSKTQQTLTKDPSLIGDEQSTDHGNVRFFDTTVAAQQAALDAANWLKQKQAALQASVGATPGALPAILPFVAAAGSSMGAAGSWANFGLALGNLVMQSQDNSDNSSSLQIQVQNLSSQPVVLYQFKPNHADVSNFLPPLATGDSGVFVLTNEDNFGNTSSIELTFLVGGVEVVLTYAYTDHNVSTPGRWTVTAQVAGLLHQFNTQYNLIPLYGAMFAGGANNPSFDFYTSSIETNSGEIDLVFYDTNVVVPGNQTGLRGPALAADQDGDLYVAWTDPHSTSANQIYFMPIAARNAKKELLANCGTSSWDPALTFFNNTPYVAWVGGANSSNSANVYCEPVPVPSNPQPIQAYADHTPALAVWGDTLFVAWNLGGTLYCAPAVSTSSSPPKGTSLSGAASIPPALAFCNTSLYLAYVNSQNQLCYVQIQNNDNVLSFGTPTTLGPSNTPYTTQATPALATVGTNLYAAFTDTNGQLQVLEVLSNGQPTTSSTAQPLNQTCDATSGPALAPSGQTLYIAWNSSSSGFLQFQGIDTSIAGGGAATFLDDSTGQDAASQAALDVNSWQTLSQTALLQPGAQPASIAKAIAAVASVATAGGNWSSFGVNLANTVMNAPNINKNKPTSLEIQVSNFSSQAIVLQSCLPSQANVSNTFAPLASGESGVVVITYESPFDSTSYITLTFWISGIEVIVTYQYQTSGVSSPGRWVPQVTVDGVGSGNYTIDKDTMQLDGAKFIGNTGFPSFDLFTSSIETNSGQIDLLFYDHIHNPQGAQLGRPTTQTRTR